MQAVSVNDINAATFTDVVNTGQIKDVIGTGCVIIPKAWLEIYADWLIECEASQRLKEPQGKLYSIDEVMARNGITWEMIDSMPEVELDGVDD